MKALIQAEGTEITVISNGNDKDYISLTDIAKYKSNEPNDVIKNWLRRKDTIEFLGLWEQLYNPNFKPVEFDGFKNAAGSNSFTLAPQKWIESTNAIGLISKSGRYGGTFAYKDIAFEFASWISAEFKLYIIKDYERLKADENSRLSVPWNVNRMISKINYKIHTDAIKEHLIPEDITKLQQHFVYADEADVLNVALFGQTARSWREAHPEAKGNIRDNATIQQLIVLSNLESMNAELIRENLTQSERLVRLNRMAISQMKSLLGNQNVQRLEEEK